MSWLNALRRHGRVITKFKGEGPTQHAIIEQSVHTNGSGPNAFGGHKHWPHISIGISFPPDATEETRTEMLDLFEDLLERHGYQFESTHNWKL